MFVAQHGPGSGLGHGLDFGRSDQGGEAGSGLGQQGRAVAHAVGVGGDNVRGPAVDQGFGAVAAGVAEIAEQALGRDLGHDPGRGQGQEDVGIALHAVVAFGVGQNGPVAQQAQLEEHLKKN